jgi:BlaI family transcriptional regulator, penicillinase repressor
MPRARLRFDQTVQLGPFQEQVLRKIRNRGSATVRELLDDGDFPQAYTTVMTTIDRLYKKGLLNRVAEGKAFRYNPTPMGEDLHKLAVLNIFRQLLGSGETYSVAFSHLIETLSAQDAQLLDDLQLVVERKRREMEDQRRLRERE